METNTKNRDTMFDKISQINAVEGFDPSAFVEEYEGFDGKPITGIPVAVQEAWFRLKYPEGRIAVHAEIGPNKDSIVAHARIYKHYADPDVSYLAEASASRSYSEKAPNVSPREWAQTAAIGIALRHAGFGLQFRVAGEPALPIANELLTSGTNAGREQPIPGDAIPEAETESPTKPIDPLEAAKQTPCPLKKYDGRTLGELVMLDPGFLKWMATKYQNEEHPEVPAAAKLICEHALKTA
ncbi:MAG: hypothetical protein RR482_02030 [Clostridia bacterium]